MTLRKNQVYFTVLFLVFFGLSPAIAEETSPRHAVDTLLDCISNLNTNAQLSPKEIITNENLSNRALAVLDLHEVSRKTLGKHWENRTAKEKEKFIHLLSQMFIKKAFPSSGKFFSSLKLTYGKITTKNFKANVSLTVIHGKEGEIEITFHLKKNSDRWQVVDVDLDEISMGNNLRSKFYKIISKNGYQELIRRIEEKVSKVKS